MAKTPSTPAGPRLCPTCGTRVGTAATKCLVCGADLTLPVAATATPAGGRRSIFMALRGPYGLVIILLAVGLVLAIGALVMAATTGFPSLLDNSTDTPTATATWPPTFTQLPTETETPVPTFTPLPPIEYVVKPGDLCSGIAATYKVSVQSIIELNNLPPNCLLSVGKALLIPQPTPTPTLLPTITIAGFSSPVPLITHTVLLNETCGGIARGMNIALNDLIAANSLDANCTIRPGDVLVIPYVATPGPTPTATPLPPYIAPYQLSPADGERFIKPEDTTVTLQWASIGELREDEAYLVVVEDVTCDCARTYRQTATETKLILPETFRPTEAGPHLYRWTVTTVRTLTAANGAVTTEPAGATSVERGFIWNGAAAP